MNLNIRGLFCTFRRRIVALEQSDIRSPTRKLQTDFSSVVISKVMKRLLYNQLYDYLSENELLSENQFGFRKGHSTSTALLDCTNEWYINMDRKY